MSESRNVMLRLDTYAVAFCCLSKFFFTVLISCKYMLVCEYQGFFVLLLYLTS